MNCFFICHNNDELYIFPGSIPFAILWHTGRILDINDNINKKYSYRITIYKFKVF